ncbi:cytochrome P450 [Xylaria bambusicola]|uniref:cytochrome P450 n=1 Tax=Xylaria bambusicola TaxID=326684 RepID=UPI002007C085|nr:cytochrome P450 [Xylaria bambusicola]KAI0516999.1 cytochrome P450 [Xylaria bambusicola]
MLLLYLLAALVVSGTWLWQWRAVPSNHLGFPRVQREPRSSHPVSSAVLKGYTQISRVSGRPFWLRYWQRDYLVLPAKYLPDIRRANREHLSFFDSIKDTLFQYNWLSDLFKLRRMTFAVIRGVNSQLPKLAPIMFEESQLAFDEIVGLKEGETGSFEAMNMMTDICLQTMVRVVAGKELSRNRRFLNAARAYFDGNFLTGIIMLNLPFRGQLRDTIAWPLYKYHQHFRQRPLIEMIEPVVAKRIEDHKMGQRDKEEKDAIQCTLDILHDFPFDEHSRVTPSHALSHETLQLIWASGQSPALSITTILFKLLEEPDYIEPLREEAKAAIDHHGWTDSIFQDLHKMDSFIRETHRLYSTFSINATRAVIGQPFTFSDGLTIPVGVRIGFAAEGCQRDPEFIADPEPFDGFRFVKLIAADAKQEDRVGRWAASHPSYSNLIFGYGNHACPGRFISIRLIKILMCRILLYFEMSWDRRTLEPPRLSFEGLSFPDVKQKIILKRRLAVA